MISQAELRRRGTEVCRRLAEDVAGLVPQGIGRWEPTWGIVAEADAEFMAELTAWEADPSDRAKQRVKRAYSSVLGAWRRAVVEYERERASP